MSSTPLGDIVEGEVIKPKSPASSEDGSDLDGDDTLTESVLFPAKPTEGETPAAATDDKAENKPTASSSSGSKPSDSDPNSSQSSADAKPASGKEDTPIARIISALPALSEQEQQHIRENLERLGQYPAELPLSASWALYFSDTSGTAKGGSHHGGGAATQEQYTESHRVLFTCDSVPALCGSLKALKGLASKNKRARTQNVDSMGIAAFRPGQNLHFFRSGVSPTWEDPVNAKGGRLTISPAAGLIDIIYERLVLLLAGASLEQASAELLTSPGRKGGDEGLIVGVVASRRARGDRIELWLAGKEKGVATPQEWVDCLKERLSVELEMPELRTGKYKKHF